MLKVLYLDLGLSKEDFSINAKRYGGAGVVPRFLKQEKDIEFFTVAPFWCYENFRPEDNTENCLELPLEAAKAIEKGYPIDRVIGGLEKFDMICHFHGNLFINKGNLKIPLVHFAGFDGACGHPNNDYILLYLKSFIPLFGEKAKYVKLGKPVPQIFEPFQKKDYVFQVSRHDDFMRSIITAKNCLKYGIQGIFAGPIHNNYPLLECIDNKTTFYLGEISESKKMDLHKHARMFCLPHNWNVPFNQSVIEANGVGTPIAVTNRGPFFKEYLKEGLNGFFLTEDNFLDCYNKSGNINQEDCWKAAKEYSIEEMVASFKKAFEEIKNEWKNNE